MQQEISKFDPLKKEVTELVEAIKKVVSSSSEKTGYDLMKENKKVLQKKRKFIKDTLGSEREGLRNAVTSIIKTEKDLLEIIEPVETELKEKIAEIDEAKAREERKELLPERKEKLEKIKLILTDDEILDMDEKAFATFYIEEQQKYLDKKQEEIDEIERKENEAEQKKIDDEQRKKDIEQAKIDAVEAERKRAKDEQAKKEAEEKKEKRNLARRKAYQEFLKENGVTKENKPEFIEVTKGETVILYKKVAEFNKV